MTKLTRDQQIASLKAQIKEWRKLGFIDNNEEMKALREQPHKLEVERSKE